MKSIFKSFFKMLWRHKLLSIICILALIIIIILLFVFASIFVGGNNKYGHRLDGIKAVELSKKELSSLADDIEKDGSVKEASVRLEGKIVYVDIDYNKDVKLDKAKEVASKTLDNFSDKEKEFYDFEYVLTQSDNDKGFQVTGTKSPKIDKISWIKS